MNIPWGQGIIWLQIYKTENIFWNIKTFGLIFFHSHQLLPWFIISIMSIVNATTNQFLKMYILLFLGCLRCVWIISFPFVSVDVILEIFKRNHYSVYLCAAASMHDLGTNARNYLGTMHLMPKTIYLTNNTDSFLALSMLKSNLLI